MIIYLSRTCNTINNFNLLFVATDGVEKLNIFFVFVFVFAKLYIFFNKSKKYQYFKQIVLIDILF